MIDRFLCFEKYAVAPHSRDYYGLKVYQNQVILYLWKISFGPHSSPVIQKIEFSRFQKEKQLKEEIQYIFGQNVSKYLKLIISEGSKTLLTLPKFISERLVGYLEVEDFINLFSVSPICKEVFDTESIWKAAYQQLKGSLDLSEMEQNVSKNIGFKKLVKDHYVRNKVMKTIDSIDHSNPAFLQSLAESEKMYRSVSSNILKPTLSSQAKKVPKFIAPEDDSRYRTNSRLLGQTKKIDLPKKSVSEKRSSTYADAEQLIGRNAALEGYRTPIRTAQKTEEKIAKIGNLTLFNEKKEEAEEEKEAEGESALRKNNPKSAILQSDLFTAEIPNTDDPIRSKSLTVKSPRSTFFAKYSDHVLGDQRAKGKPKPAHRKKPKPQSKPKTADQPNARGEERNDESNGSGMSYLMRRYLEASDDATRRSSERQHLARNSRHPSARAAEGKAPQKELRVASNESPVSASDYLNTEFDTQSFWNQWI